ncbi:MAG TPA: hypothetical protein VFT66_26525 [Roseiflexaceae bacterium]|nr:hypothetical protein [Roseiflexaceae bacterium]
MYTFEALLSHQIQNDVMLKIAEQLYATHHYNLQKRRCDSYCSIKAAYMYLNDGSVFKDHIVCLGEPLLRARRVYNISFCTSEDGSQQLQCFEPHIVVEGGQRLIDSWEHIAVPFKKVNNMMK